MNSRQMTSLNVNGSIRNMKKLTNWLLSNWLSHCLTDQWMDKWTDWWNNCLTEWLSGSLNDCLIAWTTNRPTNWLTDWLTDQLTDVWTDRWMDWPTNLAGLMCNLAQWSWRWQTCTSTFNLPVKLSLNVIGLNNSVSVDPIQEKDYNSKVKG